MISIFDPSTWFHPEAWALFFLRDSVWKERMISRLIGAPGSVGRSSMEYDLLNAYGLLFACQNDWVDISTLELPTHLFRHWQGADLTELEDA